MSDTEERLVAEVEALRASVEALRLQVVSVDRRLREVENSDTAGSSAGYTVVSAPVGGASGAVLAGSGPIDPTSDSKRRLLAEEIGHFLRRCVQGVFRGSSGRDRLALQSRLYIVIADYQGNIFDPPLFFSAFAPVRSRCKEGSCCGRAIFIGFATKWEARVALTAGGFSLPAEVQ